MYVANAKDQSSTVAIENFFYIPSFFSVSLSKAHSTASGRRSPSSTYLPDFILKTKEPEMPNGADIGRIRVGGSLKVAWG